MDQNGQADTNSMILDQPSPKSNNTSKDMLDEPILPRRNSEDDNDTSRPRKRPAVMASPDDQREPDTADTTMDIEPADNPNRTHNHPVSPTVSNGDSNGNRKLDANKTMHIRGPQSDNSASSESKTNHTKKDADDLSPSTDADPAGGSDTQELPEVEVELVEEVDEGREPINQITLVDLDAEFEDDASYTSQAISATHDSDDDSQDLIEISKTVKQLSEGFHSNTKMKIYTIERVLDELVSNDYPLVELRGLSIATNHLLTEMAEDESKFVELYLRDRILSENLPRLMPDFFGRTRGFSESFIDRGGMERIIEFMGSILKLSARLIQHDTKALQTLAKDGQPKVYCHDALNAIAVTLHMKNDMTLFEIIRLAGYPMAMWFPRVLKELLLEDGFLDSLLPFTRQVLDILPTHPKLLAINWEIIHICTALVKCIESIRKTSVGVDQKLKDSLVTKLAQIFLVIEDGFRRLLKTPVQALDPAKFVQQTYLLGSFAYQLYSTVHWQHPIMARLENVASPVSQLPPTEVGYLAEWTVKFPILHSMLASPRMEFRIRGLNQMTENLVQAWKFSGINWRDSKIIQYLVRFILKHKVVEYLVGPDSHLELITRCANVPSFLLVSESMTKEILDAVWYPISSNRDPRIVQATLQMHEEMMANMSTDQLLDLCRRINKMPYTSFDTSLMDFISQVVDKLRNNYKGTFVVDSAAYSMLIRLIRLSFELHDSKRGDNQLAPSLIFEKANTQLLSLTEVGPIEELRRQIYDECVIHVKEGAPCRTGSIVVILSFLRHRNRDSHRETSKRDDVAYLTELRLPELVVQELCTFLTEKKASETVSFISELNNRLELLFELIQTSPDCLSTSSQAQLWSSIIANHNLDAFERDRGFQFYIMFDPKQLRFQPILDPVFREYLPKLDADFFSPMILPFTRNSLAHLKHFPDHNAMDESEQGSNVVDIPGVEQLWRIILCAADENLAQEAIAYFATLYLDSVDILRADCSVVQATHLRILTRCIDQLSTSATELSESSSPDNNGDSIPTARRYNRSLHLLEYLVTKFKKRPVYGSKILSTDPSLRTLGETMTIKFRWRSPTFESAMHTIRMGSNNTGRELWQKLATEIKGRNRTILRGAEVKLNDEPEKTLKEFGFTEDCFLQIYNQPEEEHSDDDIASNDGSIPAEVMKHFEELYKLLSLPEPFSMKAWEFLRVFPAHDSVRKQLRDKQLLFSELYPQTRPYKFMYSLYALDNTLDTDETHSGRNGFLLHSISMLVEALTSCDLDNLSSTMATVLTRALGTLNRIMKDSELRSSLHGPAFGNPETFVQFLLDVLKASDRVHSELPEVEHSISGALQALFGASRWNVEIRESFSQGINPDDLIRRYLVDEPRLVVRQSARDALVSLCDSSSSQSPSSLDLEFAEHLWRVISKISEDDLSFSERLEEFFTAAFAIFDFLCQSESTVLDFDGLYEKWVSQLCSHQLSETVGRPTEDQVVKGYTRLLRYCVHFGSQRDVKFDTTKARAIWAKLLYPVSQETKESIPVLHDDNRSELYNLLLEMSNTHEEKMNLIKLNNELFHDETPLITGHFAERERWLVGPTGFGGLVNLSNTCYLNSLMTQLFMNACFRQFFMNLQINNEQESRKLSNCLSVIFARMQIGLVRAHEPKAFVDSLTDFQGQPIDPTIQMDVDEFFNLLFDRLEGEMPTESVKALFRSFYGGTLVQQVKSKECSHISERTEAFSAIQCDIKGKSTLHQSLKAYVEGELMEGDNKYRCTTCDKLVDAVKRTCLKQVPDHLILHLKRFDFDLQTMNRSKINDYFEFPNTLDMRPYTMEHLAAKEAGEENDSDPDEFELVGVLVHTGTAESGHYYSYIRDRFSPAETPSWYEFNDSDVSFFNPTSIPAACFGGSDNSNTGYSLNKSYSAYMLFYQRTSSLHQFQDKTSSLLQNHQKLLNFEVLRPQIVQDNQQRLKEYCMFGNNYIEFLRRLVTVVDLNSLLVEDDASKSSPDAEQVLRLSINAFYQICSRFKDCTDLGVLARIIEGLVLNNIPCCRYFLDWAAQAIVIDTMLVANPYPTVRQTFCKLLYTCLHHLRETSPVEYGAFSQSEDQRELSPVLKIAHGFGQAWGRLQWTMKPWNDFFSLLVDIARLGQEEVELLLRGGIMLKILEMAVAPHLNNDHTWKFVGFAKQFVKPKLQASKAAELLCILLGRCSLFIQAADDVEERDVYRYDDYMPITIEEQNYLQYQDADRSGLLYLSKYLDINGAAPHMSRLIKDIMDGQTNDSQENRYFEEVRCTLLSGVSVEPAVLAEPYLICLQSFVEATRSAKQVQLSVRRVAQEVQTIGNSGGMEHLDFFQNVCSLDCHIDPVPFVVATVGIWAPPLLVYHEEEVRDTTESFLEQLLAHSNEEPGSVRFRKPFVELAMGCFQFITEKMRPNRRHLEHSMFTNVMRVLQRCREYQDDDTAFLDRCEELNGYIHNLTIEEEDIDLASDDWACSEVDSDIREPIQIDD